MESKYFFNLEEEVEREPLPKNQEMSMRFLKHLEFSGVNIAQLKSKIDPHHHSDHDEIIVVIRGEHEFTVADETRKVKPGDLVVVPAGVPHGVNAGKEYAVLSIYAPAWEEENPDRVFLEKKTSNWKRP